MVGGNGEGHCFYYFNDANTRLGFFCGFFFFICLFAFNQRRAAYARARFRSPMDWWGPFYWFCKTMKGQCFLVSGAALQFTNKWSGLNLQNTWFPPCCKRKWLPWGTGHAGFLSSLDFNHGGFEDESHHWDPLLWHGGMQQCPKDLGSGQHLTLC